MSDQTVINIPGEFELRAVAGLSLPPGMESRKPPIRSTPLATLDECARKFMYVSRLGISPKTVERPLGLGSILHLTLSALFQGLSETEAFAVAEAAVRRDQEKMMGWADPAGYLPDGQDLKAALEDLDEDYHKARAMAIVFWRNKAFDTKKWDILTAPDGTKMVEVIISVNVKGLSRPVRTTCDLALVNKDNGEVWIVDFKSTSFDPMKRAQPTRFSPQLALYRIGLQMALDHWALEYLNKDRPPGTKPVEVLTESARKGMLRVVGSFHAIIQKPGIKYCPKTKDKGGFGEYIVRLVEWYKEKETNNPNHPPMILDPNRFGKPIMTREFWRRLINYCVAADIEPHPDLFPKAGEGACFKYNRVCPFMPLCVSDEAMWPGIIRDFYTIRFREDEEEHDAEA